MSSKTAVLLVNLGTPTSTSTKDVKAFIREFLLDSRVIDLPGPLRKLLVDGVIVPFRSTKTAKAYQKIWTKNGSPLLVNSQALQQKLNLQLNQKTAISDSDSVQDKYDVWLAMRYGKPKLNSILDQILQNNYTRIIILPLYPQYASASTGSVLEKSLKYLSDFRYIPKICCINEFYDDDGYIGSLANILFRHWQKTSGSHILFSYHGIPQKQLQVPLGSQNNQPICNQNNPCNIDYSKPTKCYRAQCYTTTHLVAQKLNLQPEEYSTSFQSRLGKLPWVGPYTEDIIKSLRDKNITDLTVICPSFVVDCLETTEEIGIRLRTLWLESGGTTFNLIPCLNDSPDWIEALAKLIYRN